MKICIADLRDVIMGVKSNLKNFKDFDWGGIRSFPLTLHVGLVGSAAL